MNLRQRFKLAMMLVKDWNGNGVPDSPDKAVDQAGDFASSEAYEFTAAELLDVCAEAAEVVVEEEEE